MKKRIARVSRKTKETDIKFTLNIDGTGKNSISTGLPFFDHMLSLFSKHGLFDINLKAKGDIKVDPHHTVEDIGICLGQAFNKALGNRSGIERYGSVKVPMDEALSEVTIDVSGRAFSTFEVLTKLRGLKELDAEVLEEFFWAFAKNAKMTLHLELIKGKNRHHMYEAIFKAFGVALSKACVVSPRKKGVPSTKGLL